MITTKQRAELRAKANKLDAVLMVGKGGISDQVIAQTETVLESKELVKGRVLEAAMLSAREVCDALCEATGAEAIQVVGSIFVLFRKSKKLERERLTKERNAKEIKNAKKVNPVRAGAQARRKKAKEARERTKEYYHLAAVKSAIEKRQSKAAD